jgi:hypothetical protein
MKIRSLAEWYAVATPEQKISLTRLLGGPNKRAGLYQLRLDPGNPVARGASASRAGEIEIAVATLAESDPTVPIITRGHICTACSKCEYWLKENNSEA